MSSYGAFIEIDLPPIVKPEPVEQCGRPLDCGGSCYLPPDHDGPCLCIGDVDGEPGTCPA